MISREDAQDVYEILIRSELWDDILEIKSWFNSEKDELPIDIGTTNFNNIILVKLGKRTERSGGKENQISLDATIPLLKIGMVVLDSSLEYLLIKKVKPVLKWDLTHGFCQLDGRKFNLSRAGDENCLKSINTTLWKKGIYDHRRPITNDTSHRVIEVKGS